MDNVQPYTFRITKPIIPKVYNITVQFRVSSQLSDDSNVRRRLSQHIGTRIDGGILMERTKRSKPPKTDATRKVKSLLMYTDLGDGVTLVTHLTVILQCRIPKPVAKFINYLPQKFQSWTLGEACETAYNTNRYLSQLIPVAGGATEEQDQNNDEFSSAESEQFLDAQSSFLESVTSRDSDE